MFLVVQGKLPAKSPAWAQLYFFISMNVTFHAALSRALMSMPMAEPLVVFLTPRRVC